MMSPVWVDDVAAAFVRALDQPSAIAQTYTLGGPEDLSWTEMLRRVAAAVGKKKVILPIPIALLKIGATLLDWIPAFPVTRDQLTMLAEGNTAPDTPLRTLIERGPAPFTAATLGYLRE